MVVAPGLVVWGSGIFLGQGGNLHLLHLLQRQAEPLLLSCEQSPSRRHSLIGCVVLSLGEGSFIVACGLSSCGVRAKLPHGMCALSSPAKELTCVPCIARQNLNPWITKHVPMNSFLHPWFHCMHVTL